MEDVDERIAQQHQLECERKIKELQELMQEWDEYVDSLPSYLKGTAVAQKRFWDSHDKI